jgi:hypothetical protein
LTNEQCGVKDTGFAFTRATHWRGKLMAEHFMPPTIVFPGRDNRVFETNTMEFPAIIVRNDGVKAVTCFYTLEEMTREHARGTPKTFEKEFHRLRPQIEIQAKQKILANLVQEQRDKGCW